MDKIRISLIGSFWFLALALPATALALGGVALLDEHLPTIANKLALVAHIDWPALKIEASVRWPEVAGMIIGQLLIFGFLLLRSGKPRLASK
jgi:hypothetical protein